MDTSLISQPCPCGRSRTLQECCYRYISGKAQTKTPEQTMRSRYTAYALGGCGEYLLSTWFPITARDLTAEELSQNSKYWKKLEILNKTQEGDEGTVEFKAYFEDNDKTEKCMHEESEFIRIAGKWLYIGGRVK